MEWHVAPISNESGETTHYISIQRDITQRKWKEQKIGEQAALLDITADAIVVSDLENQIVFWNKGASVYTVGGQRKLSLWMRRNFF